MRLSSGLVILGLGVVGLCWWARAEYAPIIEAQVLERALGVTQRSVHGVEARVAGRDIALHGLADGPAERDRLMSEMRAVYGERVVTDDLQVLPVVDPLMMQAHWGEGQLAARGHAPTEAARIALDALGARGLELAAGAPDGAWGGVALAGVRGLTLLESGQMELRGRALTITGVARTPVEGDAARAAVAERLPADYESRIELIYQDDGTPPAYQVHYSVGLGPWLEGKLPVGVSAGDVAAALGFDDIDNGANVALLGEAGAVSPVLAALRGWLPEIETLDVSVAADATTVDVGFGAGADLELLGEALRADLPGAEVTVHAEVASEGDGAVRRNAVLQRDEVLQGGFWLPTAGFVVSREACVSAADGALAANRIGFVTGSARLDARARGAVNALAAVLGPCLSDAGLRAEIGGHTDATGSDEANLALSLARAQAVREALVARGVPTDGLSAQGYGAAQPVADNATEEGRAANRRTAVLWLD